MEPSSPLRGVVPILPTPFTADDSVDFASVNALVEFAIKSGATAVGTPAYASEFYKLDESERTQLLEVVLAGAKGRLRVVAQCNHHSPKHAARLAQAAAKMGAFAINIALPRSFPSAPAQLLTYARTVCDAVDLPVIVQDWNPAGGSVGVDFAVQLHRYCRNFQYLKLEDPGIGPLIRAIKQETGEAVQVFLGWGGMYMLELQRAGACGAMPGLGLTDILVRIWRLLEEGKFDEAMASFARILPYLNFSLRSLEQHHHVDKQLLVARAVLREAHVRPVTIALDEDAQHYLQRVIRSAGF